MTPHEIEKTIEFILQSQARSEVRQDRTDEQIAELVEERKRMAREMHDRDRRWDARAERLDARVDKLDARVDKLTGGLQSLRDACRHLLDQARLTEVRLGRLEQPEG